MVKLWHDDVRPAPEGWVWATNNKSAQMILEVRAVSECSLDHDLGAEGSSIFTKGSSPDGTGYDLVKWMIENDCVPQKITIHSWNVVGAERMAKALQDAGHSPIVKPFAVSRETNWAR